METVTLTGSYNAISSTPIELNKGDYILIKYTGAAKCKIDLEGIAYTAYTYADASEESFGTKA